MINEKELKMTVSDNKETLYVQSCSCNVICPIHGLTPLHSHTKEVNIDLLEKYSDFLHKNGYIDTDYYTEEPKAVDRFLDSLEDKTPKKTAGTWKGKELNEMSKEELIKALEDLNNLYLTALEDNKK